MTTHWLMLKNDDPDFVPVKGQTEPGQVTTVGQGYELLCFNSEEERDAAFDSRTA